MTAERQSPPSRRERATPRPPDPGPGHRRGGRHAEQGGRLPGYGEAAVLDLLLRVLPQVVEAAAAPVAAIDKITVISTDGASSITKAVASNVAQGLQLGTDLTGIDLSQLLSRLSGQAADTVGNTSGNGAPKPVTRPRAKAVTGDAAPASPKPASPEPTSTS